MHVVAVVAEEPGLAESALANRLIHHAQHAARLPVPLIRLVGSEAPAAVVASDGPHLPCHSVAELTASLQQLRYAGAQWAFVDCQLPFATVGEALASTVDLFVVPAAADRRSVARLGGIVGVARRLDRRLVFALGGAAALSKVTAASALALSHFAPVVPAGLLDTPTSAAELLQAIERLVSSAAESPPDAGSECLQDWAATIGHADGKTSACEVIRIDVDSWRIRTATPLGQGETLTLTLSMLGRFDVMVRQSTDDGAIVDLCADARRQQRLGERLAARLRARLAPTVATPTAVMATADAATNAAVAPGRRVHPLLQQVAEAPVANEKIRGLNQIVARQRQRDHRPPGRIVVVGNEKGGSGKSTLAIHLVVSMLRAGFEVATVDLDSRQGSLTRYLDNRRTYAERNGTALLHPSSHTVIEGHTDELHFSNLLMDLSRNRDLVVLDTPGHDQPLSRLAHLFADTVITPINDSFLDLDVIARLDSDTANVVEPSHYGRMMQQVRHERGGINGLPDWIVVRNRLSTVLARNKVDMAAAVERLSRQMGFRVGPGLTERVIYRELFPFGLTLLDLREQGVGMAMTMSHVAARQELRALLQLLIPDRAAPARASHAGADDPEAATSAAESDLVRASVQVGTVLADTPRPVEHVDAG